MPHDGYRIHDGYHADGYQNWVQIDDNLEGNFNGSPSVLIRHKGNNRFHLYLSKSTVERMLALFTASGVGG